MGSNHVSRPGVLELQSEDLPVFLCPMWYYLKETKFLLKACLDVWKSIAASVCVQKCNVVIWHGGYSHFQIIYKQNSIFVPDRSQQAKTDAPALPVDFCVLNFLDVGNHWISIIWIVLWSMDYKYGSKFPPLLQGSWKIPLDLSDIGPKQALTGNWVLSHL